MAEISAPDLEQRITFTSTVIHNQPQVFGATIIELTKRYRSVSLDERLAQARLHPVEQLVAEELYLGLKRSLRADETGYN